MLNNIKLQNILFLDIETVSQHPDFELLSETEKQLWDEKSAYFRAKNEVDLADSYNRAGIYAEFGKIVCISVGYLQRQGADFQCRIKSYYSDTEADILNEFAELLRIKSVAEDYLLCAHNGKEFDFPYIARRMLINGIKIPYILQTQGKKPWEVSHLDTMELWKFGDWKNYTSLKLLAHAFGIPSPKSDIDGSQVGAVYWEDKDLERIAKYCGQDVLTIVQLFLRYRGEKMVDTENVFYV